MNEINESMLHIGVPIVEFKEGADGAVDYDMIENIYLVIGGKLSAGGRSFVCIDKYGFTHEVAYAELGADRKYQPGREAVFKYFHIKNEEVAF